MRTYTTFAAIVMLISMLHGNADAECSRLHLQGLQFGAGREVTARLSCLTKDGALALTPNAADYELLVGALFLSRGQRAVTSAEPIDLVAVIQVSAIMEDAISDIKKALHRVASELATIPGSTVALVTYDADVHIVTDLGRVETFEQAVDKLTTSPDTEPHLLQGIEVASSLISKLGAKRRRVVLVVSDGTDLDMSPRKAVNDFKEAGDRARAAGIVVAPVGYAPFDLGRLHYLLGLTNATGGHWRFTRQSSRIEAECQALMEELAGQQLVTFSLPQEFHVDQGLFLVGYEGGATPIYSELVNKTVPAALPVPAASQGPPKSWSLWVSLVGLLISVSLFVLTVVRKSAPTSVAPQPALEEKKAAAGKTTVLHQGKRVVVGWVVKLNPAGGHETIFVGDILTLGKVPYRHQVSKLPDGFEIVHLDDGSTRRRIEDGHMFWLNGEQYKFKSVNVER